MIEELTFRFKRDVTEFPNGLTITAVGKTGTQLLDEWYETGVSVAMVEQPLYSAGSVLEGERTNLLKCGLSGRWIVAIPAENEAVELDVRDVADDSSYLDEPLPIDKETLLEALIEFAEWYREQRAEVDPDPCALTRLEVGIADARRRLEYYREQHSQDGYQPTIDHDHLETFLFECRKNDRLQKFVLETDAVESLVNDLQESNDHDYVDERYYRLLAYHDSVAERTLELLHVRPDDRALLDVKNICWGADPDLSPLAITLVPKLDIDSTIEVGSTLITKDEPDISIAAVQALADLSPDDLEPAQLDRVVSTLQRGKRATDDETLESRIDEALVQFE